MNKTRTNGRIDLVLPNLGGGGAERVSLSLAEEFLQHGLEVTFVLMRREGELLDEVPAACRIIDLEAERFRNAWLPLHCHLRRERPDAMLVNMWPLTGVACMAVRTSQVPVRLLVAEHTDFRKATSIKSIERLVLKQLGRQIYAPASTVVAVSAGVAEGMQESAGLAKDRVHVIHNPVRTFGATKTLRSDIALMDWWQGGSARLLAVGSLKEAKAYDFLIRALAQLREKLDARLIILGEGHLRSQLEMLVRELQLSDAIRMPGFRNQPQPFFAGADVFVLSSEREGLPGALIEALAFGTPVVSTDCLSGPAEILENGRYGQLVPVGDKGALVDAIYTALSNHHDREDLKRRSRDFSVSHAAQAYLDLLL